jgi:hypothetical protein
VCVGPGRGRRMGTALVVGTPPHVCPVEVQLQPQRTA